MPSFRVETSDEGRITVHGDLDAATAPQLRAVLESARDDVEIDFAPCTFMDSSGISVLTEARMRYAPNLTVVDVSRPVRLVLEVSGLSHEFLSDLQPVNGDEPAPPAS